MRRRLIPQGHGGFTIYLPKKWVKEQALKGGEDLYVDLKDNQILISTNEKPEKTITLEITTSNKHLLRTILSSYYRLGFTQIILESNKLTLDIVKSAINSLKGYSVTEHTQKSFTIRDIANQQDLDTNQQIIKFFQKINFFFDSIFINHSSKNNILTLHEDILEHRDYCERTIVRERTTLSYEYYSFVVIMSKIKSIYYKLSSESLSKKDLTTLNNYHSFFKKLYSLFLKKDKNESNKLYLELRTLRENIELELKKISNKVFQTQIGFLIEMLFTLSSRLQIIVNQIELGK